MATKKKVNTLHELLLNKLRVLTDVEDEIIKALPKLAKQATSKELKAALESHLKETKQQAERLKQCFKILGEKPQKLKSEAIRGLNDDAEWVTKNVEAGPALDANLIAAVQYVEHYETAGYGTAAHWADVMGHEEVKNLLGKTLDEEKAADEKLNNLAMDKLNPKVEPGMEE